MSERTGWGHRLRVVADGKGLVGHAGAVLLHQVADRVGLTAALERLFPAGGSATWRDRAHVLLCLSSAIVLGATSVADAEQLQLYQRALFGTPASDSTTHRLLESLDEPVRLAIAKVRARARRHVWSRLHLRPGGFPWLVVAGKRLTGWIVIDMDATIIVSSSKKQGGSNTVADHITVLTRALAQIPDFSRAKILVRVDGAGATHDLLEHLEKLNTARRTVRYLVGWTITHDDEKAIAKIPEENWEAVLTQHGDVQDGYGIAELTGLSTRTGWPAGQRLLVRRVKPSGRQLKKLTAFEKATGWKYSVVATNIARMWGIAGSHQPQFLDVLARSHAVVEDRARVDKAMGLRNLPSKKWQVNQGWMLAANLGHDLDCWVRLLALHDQEDLERAEPDTMRFRLCSVPATFVANHARYRWLRLERTRPWADTFALAWQRLTSLPAPA